MAGSDSTPRSEQKNHDYETSLKTSRGRYHIQIIFSRKRTFPKRRENQMARTVYRRSRDRRKNDSRALLNCQKKNWRRGAREGACSNAIRRPL